MEKSRNLGPLLIILVVLLVAVGTYITREDKWPEVLLKFGIELKSDFGLKTMASEGALIAGFPNELLSVVSDAKVIESGLYTSNDLLEKREKLTAIYQTAGSIPDMFAAYITLLTERGYTVLQAGAQRGETRILAERGEQSVSLKMYAKKFGVNEVEIAVLADVLE